MAQVGGGIPVQFAAGVGMFKGTEVARMEALFSTLGHVRL